MKLEEYMSYPWQCEDCGCANISDLTLGVEVECEDCGSVCPAIDDEMYAEARDLYRESLLYQRNREL